MKWINLLPMVILYSACSNNGNDTTPNLTDKDGKEVIESAEVVAVKLELSDFNHEIVSNGKVESVQKASLFFDNPSGYITELSVKNGSRVNAGAKIAQLDSDKLELEVRKCDNAIAKSVLDYQDALISQGYDPDDEKQIPEDIKRLAELRSGLTDSRHALKIAKSNLDNATLRTPVSGIVANLNVKKYSKPDASEPVCNILGNEKQVRFHILESEMPLISIADHVSVYPVSGNGTFDGRISSINPVVDEDGLVEVCAALAHGSSLPDGQNVRVNILKKVKDQLVVPKKAVVSRGNRQVVFTLNETNHTAQWNYVTTGLENIGHYTVTDGLEPGMMIITDGNENLAHETPVTVLKQ